MSIPFKTTPAALQVPLFYAELDNSQANTSTGTQRALVIGQITSAALAAGTVPNVPRFSQGAVEAVTVGGAGSMLALMTAAYRQNDSFGELWQLPLADDPAAPAATGTVTISTGPTAAGTLSVYIAGVCVSQPVMPGQTVAQVAAALAASIGAAPNLPVTASAAAGVVTLTAVNAGPGGNDVDVRLNYRGKQGGESTPAGLAVTITPMTGGTTAPSLAAGLLNLGAMEFDFIVMPYTDTASLDAMKAFLGDATGRWSWTSQTYGGFFAAHRGSVANQQAAGTVRNDAHGSIMGYNDSPTPSWSWAAAIAGAAAASLRADPATPLQTLPLAGVLAPPIQSRFQLGDRNTLLSSGISTFSVGEDGTVYLENLITTYQKNAFGSADNSYLQVETLYTLMFVLRDLRSVVTSKYARVKLAKNGAVAALGANVVTPNVIRGDLIGRYRALEARGLVQNATAFKDTLIVEQDAKNPNRVDVLYSPTLVGGLRIFGVLAQLRASGVSGTSAQAGQKFVKPTRPLNVVLTAIAGAVVAAFDQPADNGGAPVTVFDVMLSNGNSNSGATSPITVESPAGVAVTAVVTATNSAGTSDASAPSAPATALNPPTYSRYAATELRSNDAYVNGNTAQTPGVTGWFKWEFDAPFDSVQAQLISKITSGTPGTYKAQVATTDEIKIDTASHAYLPMRAGVVHDEVGPDGWHDVTFGGAATHTIGLAVPADANFPNNSAISVDSDPYPLESVARNDGKPGGILLMRLVCLSGQWTQEGGPNDVWDTATAQPYYRVRATNCVNGDAIADPTILPQSPFYNGYGMMGGAQVHTTVQAELLMDLGDSRDAAAYEDYEFASQNVLAWMPLSTPQRPLSIYNAAGSGHSQVSFLAIALDRIVNGGLRPTVIFVPGFSQNGFDNAAGYTSRLDTWMKQVRDVPGMSAVKFVISTDYYVSGYAGTQSETQRQLCIAYAKSIADNVSVFLFDSDAIMTDYSNPAVPINVPAYMNGDGVHASDVGLAAMAYGVGAKVGLQQVYRTVLGIA